MLGVVAGRKDEQEENKIKAKKENTPKINNFTDFIKTP
jgi:hypothetical protein